MTTKVEDSAKDAENELVRKAQSGDSQSMNDLLAMHYDRIYAVCRRLAGNDADAADACQEALIAIVKGVSRFDGRSKFSTWSYRVATNACLDELRRRKRRPVPSDEDSRDHAAPTDSAPSMEATAVQRMVLDTHLQALPLEFRAPIVCRDVIGMDYAQIAETLEIPPGTVRSRIARGRRQLAEALKEDTILGPDGNQTGTRKRQNKQP